MLGVIYTGIIALSSTTFMTNALAGLMLRMIRNYKAGDFIQTKECFGRVTERGLFHTEIQTEERNLTTFPNLYLMTRPMTVIRSSGTIISASLSLGYDIPHRRIEQLLANAAEVSGLKEVFVQIVELGDFSITYKVSGFLSETKQLLETRSNLKRSILDKLHESGVEIVSPNFMNQRVLPSDTLVIPDTRGSRVKSKTDGTKLPERVIFDKAETVEEMDQWRDKLRELNQKLADLGKKKDEDSIQMRERLLTAIEKVEKKIDMFEKLLKDDEQLKM